MRELTVNELSEINGAYSTEELGAAVFAGGVAGALSGSLAGGVGAGPGAFTGAVIGGISYLSYELYLEYIAN
ncbi:Blp family class II bacteriocin [Thalassotalea ponticola]|uniref:Blp family class II bacteriocin n=1 Tax=Thalassotalea ponticola TaxID=1523392 RepID=UPI0025B340B5|nr:Blp family class II bacteriocin [Thalassotalea ponticola]MDN3652639.1 Blp family class II bacteriocin [Thalassotalea ponticola]